MLNINASIKTRFNRCHHSGDILKMILMRPEKVIPMKPESVIPSYQKMRSRWARICIRVHCRTGSLEIGQKTLGQFVCVHCRTGSLEIELKDENRPNIVHCRTGSLENQG